MSTYIVLKDKSRNWERSTDLQSDTLQAVKRGVPGIPEITTGRFDPTELRAFSRDPNVLAVAPVINTRLIAPEPLDHFRTGELAHDWGLSAVRADRTLATGAGVTVALLDTGPDTAHSAFAGVKLKMRDFAGTGIEDANGHGTHLAGTVLGRPVDGRRIGVAPGVDRLMVGKALADDGRGRSDTFLKAFLWVVAERAQIIAFALRFDIDSYAEDLLSQGYPQSLANSHATLAYRGNLRIFESILKMISGPVAPLVLAAVGNDSRRMIAPEFETGAPAPSAARRVLSVGALDLTPEGYAAAPFSNLGPALAAPGVGIESARPGGGLSMLHGSSMALAHATGVAALWCERLQSQGLSTQKGAVAQQICATATQAGMQADQSAFDIGKGLVQAP